MSMLIKFDAFLKTEFIKRKIGFYAIFFNRNHSICY